MFRRRRDDEDPFAALKDGGPYASTSASTLPDIGLGGDAGRRDVSASPAPNAAPARTTTSAAPVSGPPRPSVPPGTPPGSMRPARLRYGFGYGGVWRFAVLAVVSLVIGSVVLTISHSVHSIKIPSFTFNTGGVTTGGGGTDAPAQPQVTPRPVHYLTPHGLRAGLARVAHIAHGGKLTLLRIDARTLNVYATRPDGRTSQIYLGPTVTFVTPAAAPGERPLPASSIRPAVLGSLLAQLHRRFGVPASRIDYVVVSSPSGQPPRWVLFVRDAAHQGYVAPLGGGAWTRI